MKNFWILMIFFVLIGTFTLGCSGKSDEKLVENVIIKFNKSINYCDFDALASTIDESSRWYDIYTQGPKELEFQAGGCGISSLEVINLTVSGDDADVLANDTIANLITSFKLVKKDGNWKILDMGLIYPR